MPLLPRHTYHVARIGGQLPGKQEILMVHMISIVLISLIHNCLIAQQRTAVDRIK